MFPTIGDLVSYLFHIPVKIGLQTFGTFMALAFAGAYLVFVSEFKRKEEEGAIQGISVMDKEHSLIEFGLNFLFGFVLGYKFLDVVLSLLKGMDPAPGLLSWQGNWPGGVLLAIVWGIWSYTDKRKPATHYMHPWQLMPFIVLMVGIFGFIGAKLFDTAEHIQELRYLPLKVLLSRSGFTYYGGLIFGALTYLYIGYRHKIRLIHLADIGSPGMMLAYGIGRIGCHLSGDGDWGIVNSHAKPGWMPQWAWASTYPHNAIDAGIYIPGCTLQHCQQLPLGVYPTPLYEAVICISLFLCMWLIRRRLKIPGAMFALFLLLNAMERLLIEIIRITPKYPFMGLQLSQAQMIALLFIAGFVWITGRYYFSPRKMLSL